MAKKDVQTSQMFSDKKIPISGLKVYIGCFYGENDHEDIARKMCEQKMRECRSAYGANNCRRINNPTQRDLDRIKDEGMVIVVTHTTPSGDATCKSGIDIWDSPLEPTQVAACIDAPIVGFGC